MNKRMIVASLAFAVFALTGAACQKPADKVTVPGIAPEQAENMEKEVTKDSGSDTISFMGGMKGLMNLGGAQECTWESGEGESGKIYTDGKQLRAENRAVVTVNDGAAQDVYIIQGEEYMYMWNPATKQGQKVNVKEMEKMAGQFEDAMENVPTQETREEMKAQDVLDAEHEFSCKRWSVDEKMFTPPTDVTFEDLSKMFEQAQEAVKEMAGACDQLTGAQKEACEDAMKQFAQ